MSRLPVFSLCLFCLVATACGPRSAFQPVKRLPAEHAVVYIYRPPQIARYQSIVLCAETTAVEVFGRSYFPYVAPAGVAIFQSLSWAERPQAGVPIRLEPGASYYLRASGPASFSLVPEATARAEISLCEQAPPVKDSYRTAREQWSELAKGISYEAALEILRATGSEMGTLQRVSASGGSNKFLLEGQMWSQNLDRVAATRWKMVFQDGELAEWTNLPPHPCDKGFRRD